MTGKSSIWKSEYKYLKWPEKLGSENEQWTDSWDPPEGAMNRKGHLHN